MHTHTHARARTRAHPHIRSPGACGNMRKTKYCNLMTKVPSFTYSLFPLYSPFSLFISLFLFCSFLDSSSPALPICTAPIFLFAAVINVTSGHECFSATCNFDGDATVLMSFWEAECRPNCAVPTYPPPRFNTEDKETECQCVWKAAVTGTFVYFQ